MSLSVHAGARSRDARSLSRIDHARSGRGHALSTSAGSRSGVLEYGRPGRDEGALGDGGRGAVAGGGSRWSGMARALAVRTGILCRVDDPLGPGGVGLGGAEVRAEARSAYAAH
jgi:hypothetical protein